MPAPDWYLVLTLIGITAVALCAFMLGAALVRTAKLKSGTNGIARQVRFRYRRANGALADLRAVIYEIQQRRDQMYFQGICLPSRAPRTFRADRVEKLVDLETGETVEDIGAWLQNLAAHA